MTGRSGRGGPIQEGRGVADGRTGLGAAVGIVDAVAVVFGVGRAGGVVVGLAGVGRAGSGAVTVTFGF